MLTRRITVRNLINDADPAVNIKLTGGEEIRVPEVSKIYVVATSRSPAPTPSEWVRHHRPANAGAQRRAGAVRQQECLHLPPRSQRQQDEIPVELDKILQRKSPDVPLIANDILYIPTTEASAPA